VGGVLLKQTRHCYINPAMGLIKNHEFNIACYSDFVKLFSTNLMKIATFVGIWNREGEIWLGVMEVNLVN